MRLFRPTTRRLMALVAVMAFAHAGIERRRAALQRLARDHWERVVANSIVQADPNGRSTTYVTPPSLSERQLVQYHSKLERKYKRAARYPWLPVLPDPPPPK